MSSSPHATTAPEDRIPFSQMLVYGMGGFVNNILAAAIGGMLIVLNLGMGMDPARVGLLGALPRLTDALTDPVVGFISDKSHTRWGRRRPFIFVGAIFSALTFAALWLFPQDLSHEALFVWFLLGSLVFYLGYTLYATPWVALGYEMTPDFHERTRLMGVQSFIGQLAWVVAPWFLWIMQNELYFGDSGLASREVDLLVGAPRLAIIVGVFTMAVGVLPAIFLKERFADTPKSSSDEDGAGGSSDSGIGAQLGIFFRGFGTALKVRPFLLLAAATFLIFNGFQLIGAFQSYVIIYYVYGGDKVAGGEMLGWTGSIGAVSTFAVIALVTWLGTRIGKRHTLFVTIGISMLGYALKWPCYNPDLPWLIILPAPLIAFGLGGLFPMMGSMIADVCDLDELQQNERREGMFGSIYWWVVKLGMSLALAGGGFLLNATGFDVSLEGGQTETTLLWMRIFDVVVPMLTSALALWAVWAYPLSEDRMLDIRRQLEDRRGARTPAGST
jgi:GPH family glycoside/pentoside/hexuronide:cation symporter